MKVGKRGCSCGWIKVCLIAKWEISGNFDLGICETGLELGTGVSLLSLVLEALRRELPGLVLLKKSG